MSEDIRDEQRNMSADEFLNLPDATEGRQTKVDYKKVIAELLGKPVPVKQVSDLMLQYSVDKSIVYPSETKRFLDNLHRKGYKVTYKSKAGKKWVLIEEVPQV